MSIKLYKDAVVTKSFNNNIVMVKVNGKEKILFSKGIGFGKKFGDIVSKDTELEKVFSIDNEENVRNLEKIINKVDNEFFAVCEEAIAEISNRINCELNESIHIGLIDHLYFSIKRLKNNEEIHNPFLVEIQTLYQKEYELAEIIANKIGRFACIDISRGEIGFIALHIHSAMNDGELSNTIKYSYLSNKIVEHVEKRLKINIDRKSLDYARFITHIRFAIERIITSSPINNELIDIIKIKYKNSYIIAKESAEILKEGLCTGVTEDEVAYLAMHIERFRVSLEIGKK